VAVAGPPPLWEEDSTPKCNGLITALSGFYQIGGGTHDASRYRY